MAGWIKRQFSVIMREGGREVNRDGRMDGCVEGIFTSANSRVIALIAAVNNSNPSSWELSLGRARMLLHRTHSPQCLISSFSLYCYF